MFESIMKFFKKLGKSENTETKSKETAKERLHLVLMQDRANVSADFLEMMKQEIIDVIKKYIEVNENEIDVRLTNEVNADGTTGAPSLYANIPIMNIKNEMKKEMNAAENKEKEETNKKEDNEKEKKETKKENEKEVEKQESKEEGNKKGTENKKEGKKDEEEEKEQEKTENKEEIKEEVVEEKVEENKEKSGE